MARCYKGAENRIQGDNRERLGCKEKGEKDVSHLLLRAGMGSFSSFNRFFSSFGPVYAMSKGKESSGENRGQGLPLCPSHHCSHPTTPSTPLSYLSISPIYPPRVEL